MLLAELPVRGASWPVLGGRVAQRVSRVEFDTEHGTAVRVRPQQWQGNERQHDVL